MDRHGPEEMMSKDVLKALQANWGLGDAQPNAAAPGPEAMEEPATVEPSVVAPQYCPPVSNKRGQPKQRCFSCGHWVTLPRTCWWIGQCAVSGKQVAFRSLCDLAAASAAAPAPVDATAPSTAAGRQLSGG